VGRIIRTASRDLPAQPWVRLEPAGHRITGRRLWWRTAFAWWMTASDWVRPLGRAR